jgi:hypothetical protein
VEPLDGELEPIRGVVFSSSADGIRAPTAHARTITERRDLALSLVVEFGDAHPCDLAPASPLT